MVVFEDVFPLRRVTLIGCNLSIATKEYLGRPRGFPMAVQVARLPILMLALRSLRCEKQPVRCLGHEGAICRN